MLVCLQNMQSVSDYQVRDLKTVQATTSPRTHHGGQNTD